MKTTTALNFNCPLCDAELIEQVGNGMHKDDAKYGVILYCPSLSCPAQEVMGHGDNAKAAFEVVQQKYKK